MGNFLRSIVAVAIATLLVASASLPVDALAGQAPRPGLYDGQWSVVIYTERGDCDSALRYSVRIVGGQVQADQASYRLAGRVAPNGAISVVVAESGRSASGYGRLYGNNGRGLWRTSTGKCAGKWTAERRG
jgi:hypothetical protein